MHHHKLVRPEHLNQFGVLFGGYLLKWVDEVSWIAASLEHPGCRFVTVGINHVEFRESVRLGSLLSFHCEISRRGRTSVDVAVEVFRRDLASGGRQSIFRTVVSFVRVNAEGHKLPLDAPADWRGADLQPPDPAT
jgi:acyl-CoA hydrolase